MAIVTKRPHQRIAQSDTFTAPVGGLNSRETLLTMAPEDAVLLENMIVEPYGVAVRRGFMKHTTGLPGEVQSLLTWHSGAGSKMFAAVLTASDTGEIYDVTTAGAAGAASLTGLANAQWRFVNFANSAGTHMVAVNGEDDPLWYRAAGLSRLTAGDGIVSGTIANVDPSTFITVTVHQRRTWFVQVDTMFGWYLAADAIYGPAVKFDFGPIFKRGGYLKGIYTWSKNTYSGPEDQLVAITSEGEAAIYVGTDPAVETKWALKGVFFITSPIGWNFTSNFSGDLGALTAQGLISMNIASDDAEAGMSNKEQISAKIQRALDDAIISFRDEYGWQVFEYPDRNYILINTPTTSQGIKQFLYHSVTGGWCILDGFNARSWGLFRGDAFFGTDEGLVCQGFIGGLDDVDMDGTGGEPILFEAQQAFNLFKAPGVNKYVVMVRPSVLSDVSVNFLIGVLLDYSVSPVFGNIDIVDSDAGLWDEDLWDHAHWGSGLQVFQKWTTVGGIGYAGSVRIKGTSTGETMWIATDWVYQVGGTL